MGRPRKIKVENAPVSISFSIGANTYLSEGETIFAALSKIKPVNYIGFGKLIVTTDGKTSHVPIKLVPTKLKRLFEKPVEMAMFAKRIKTLL